MNRVETSGVNAARLNARLILAYVKYEIAEFTQVDIAAFRLGMLTAACFASADKRHSKSVDA